MTACLDRLQHWLREQHVAFTVQHHREALTMQAVAMEVHEAGDHVAKVVIGQADGQLVFQAGTHRETLKLATEDYLRLAKPTIGKLTVEHSPVEPAAA